MILPGNALPKSRCAEGAASRRIDECHRGATRIAFYLYPPRNMREERRLRTGEVHDYWRTGGCANSVPAQSKR